MPAGARPRAAHVRHLWDSDSPSLEPESELGHAVESRAAAAAGRKDRVLAAGSHAAAVAGLESTRPCAAGAARAHRTHGLLTRPRGF